jgi:hypothetical protein
MGHIRKSRGVALGDKNRYAISYSEKIQMSADLKRSPRFRTRVLFQQRIDGDEFLIDRDEQGLIWDYFKPRHTHAWNMLVLSWRELDQSDDETRLDFKVEYSWENFIIRLWLYRTTIKTLTKLKFVEGKATRVLAKFDGVFKSNGVNALKALRDMIEHFDAYAAGEGHGPGERERDLDPWREIAKDRYERGLFCLERQQSYEAAIKLRADAKGVSDEFIKWYKLPD